MSAALQEPDPPVSVILIRENAEQLTGSGCCGKLEGDSCFGRQEDVFALARRNQQQLGLLYRTLREFFPPLDGRPQVAVVSVDPRNQLYLVPKLLRDVWRYRPGAWAALETGLQLFSLPAVVVNGRVISRRGVPLDPDSLCHHVARLLRQASSAVRQGPPVAGR